MKTTTRIVIALAAAILCWTGNVRGQKAKPSRNDPFPESDEIQRSYQLDPGAIVDVSNISGSVAIETSDTSMAEVRIVRTARSRAELAYHNIIVERQASGLVVRGESDRERTVPRHRQNPTPGKLKRKHHQRRRDHRQHRWAGSSRKHQRRGPTRRCAWATHREWCQRAIDGR